MANKFDLDFKGFLELAEDIDALGDGALQEATENALKATDAYLTPQIESAMNKAKVVNLSKHKVHTINWERTGKTKQKFDRDYKVNWEGTEASIGVGFISTPVPLILALGTPYMEGDSNLYKALKGKGKFRTAIDAEQQKAFNETLKRRLNND